MHALIRLSFSLFLVLLLSGVQVREARADSFVTAGTPGILEVEVQVTGSGSETAGPGAGLESRSWSVENSARYRVVIAASAPVIEGVQAAGSDNSEPFDEEAWEKMWEAKAEACNGDEMCEMQVAIDQASDPHQVEQMQGLSASIAAAQSSPGAAPNAQIWEAQSRTGPVHIVEKDDNFGVISETGGTVDVLCVISIDKQMSTLPENPYGLMPPMLTISEASRYTLHLPLEDGFEAGRRCDNGSEHWENPVTGSISVLGDSPLDGSSWSTALTVEGDVAAAGDGLAFEGSRKLRASVLGNPARNVTVSLKWKFQTSE